MNQPTLWNYALGDLADANELKDTAPEQGRVSLRNLFQEINAIPIANGGIAPKRKDINCLFKAIGEHIFYIQRGGQYSWQADVTYPKNAVITYNNTEYKAVDENIGMVPNLNPEIWKPLIEVTPERLQEALDALPKYTSATTSSEGLVQLSSEIDSDSETKAATPLAVKTLNDKINTTNDNINNLSSLVSTSSQNISKVTEDVSTLSSDVQSLSTRTRNLETNVSGITSNSESIQSLQTQVGNIQNACSELSGKVDNHGADIETIKTDISTLKLTAGDTSAINGLETRISNLENSAKQSEDNIGIFKYDGTKDYSVGSIVYYNKDLYRAHVPEGDETNKVIAGTIPGTPGSEEYWILLDSKLRESIANLGSEISDLKSTTSKVSGIENTTNNNSSAITTLRQTVNDLGDDVDKFDGIYRYEYETEYEAGSIIEYKDSLYKSLITTTSNPETKPDDWKKLSGDTDLSGVETRLTSLENSGSSVEKRLGTVESTIQTLEAGGADVSTLATKTELNTVSNRVQVLEGIDHSKYALKTDIPESVDTSTLATKTELNAVSNRVQTLEGIDHSRYALKTELPSTSNLATKDELKSYALKTDIPSPTDTSTLVTKKEVQAIDTRVQTLEGIDHSQYALKTNLATLEQKVKTLESSNSGLAAWSNEKTYKVSDVVIYDNKIYQATSTSLNSAPSSSNSNWKEISESEASTLLTKINAVSDRVQTLEGIDHSKYALKTEIPSTSNLATKTELSNYALKTEIPESVDTSTLATKEEVRAIDTRVQTLESSSSGGSSSSNTYQHYLVSGMLDGSSTIDTEDIGQNDWNVAYTANGPAFKSFNISGDHRVITIDFDSKYDVRTFRVDVYKTFLASDGARLLRFTLDGKTDGWNTARYYPMGWSAHAGCYNVAGTGDTKIMNQVSGINPYELQWTPTSIGEGLSFYVKM